MKSKVVSINTRTPAATRASVALAENDIQARFCDAALLEEAGEIEAAEEVYNEIIRVNPSFSSAYINLGTLAVRAGNMEDAEKHYRKAAELDSGYPLAFYNLGNVLESLGRIEEAVIAYRRAIAVNPRYADAHYNLALNYDSQGLTMEALRHFRAYVRLDSRSEWGVYAQGKIKKLLSKLPLAIVWRGEKHADDGSLKANLRLVS